MKNIYQSNNRIYKKSGFTLVEIIVTMTVFSILMISVMFIFINSSQLSMKIDINRILQENLKNIIETISEDLRKNDLKNCGVGVVKGCLNVSNISVGSELWIGENYYYLAKQNTALGEFIKIDNVDDCNTNQCFILKNGQMLSNSFVTINKLEFSLFSDHIPKVQININIKPMQGKGINTNLIKNNELNIQTTLSDEKVID